MRKPLIGAAAAWLLTASAGAMAQSLAWRVSEASGSVVIRHGAESRAAQRGSALAEGDTVSTGANGRAVLVHDRDFVTVAPNSRVAVPEVVTATGLTKLIQTLGNAVYKIEKLGVPHFGVATPYLAAVVKGTTFSVTVDGAGGSLQVTEGAVEVATLDGGARDLIRPGDVATIAAGDLARLRVQGDRERTIDSPSRAASTSGGTTPPAPEAPEASSEISPDPASSTTMQSEAVTTETPPAMIAEAISSKPTDLGAATGGLLTGTVGSPAAAIAALVASDAKAATPVIALAAPVPAPEPAKSAAPTQDTSSTPTTGATGSASGGATTPPDNVAKAPSDVAGKPAEDVSNARDGETQAAPAPSPTPPRSSETASGSTRPGATLADLTRRIAEEALKMADEAARRAADAQRDAQKAADEAAKAKDKADRDAQKSADDAARDAKKAADEAAKAQEKADRDTQKAVDDAAKKAVDDASRKSADDAGKAADDVAKAREKADKEAQKAVDDAAKKAADDARKDADDTAKAQEKADRDGQKATDDVAKKSADDARKAAEEGAKDKSGKD